MPTEIKVEGSLITSEDEELNLLTEITLPVDTDELTIALLSATQQRKGKVFYQSTPQNFDHLEKMFTKLDPAYCMIDIDAEGKTLSTDFAPLPEGDGRKVGLYHPLRPSDTKGWIPCPGSTGEYSQEISEIYIDEGVHLFPQAGSQVQSAFWPYRVTSSEEIRRHMAVSKLEEKLKELVAEGKYEMKVDEDQNFIMIKPNPLLKEAIRLDIADRRFAAMEKGEIDVPKEDTDFAQFLYNAMQQEPDLHFAPPSVEAAVNKREMRRLKRIKGLNRLAIKEQVKAALAREGERFVHFELDGQFPLTDFRINHEGLVTSTTQQAEYREHLREMVKDSFIEHMKTVHDEIMLTFGVSGSAIKNSEGEIESFDLHSVSIISNPLDSLPAPPFIGVDLSKERDVGVEIVVKGKPHVE